MHNDTLTYMHYMYVSAREKNKDQHTKTKEKEGKTEAHAMDGELTLVSLAMSMLLY